MRRPTFQQTPISRSDPVDNGVLHSMLAATRFSYYYWKSGVQKHPVSEYISPYFFSKVTKKGVIWSFLDALASLYFKSSGKESVSD